MLKIIYDDRRMKNTRVPVRQMSEGENNSRYIFSSCFFVFRELLIFIIHWHCRRFKSSLVYIELILTQTVARPRKKKFLFGIDIRNGQDDLFDEVSIHYAPWTSVVHS